MSIKVSELFAKVRYDIGDEDATDANRRWKDAELFEHLHDGETLIVALKPSALPLTAQVSLVAGTRQSLPTGAIALSKVNGNVSAAGVRGKVPTLVTPDRMNAMLPGWHSSTAAKEVKFVVYDPNDPKFFWNYPPQPAATDQKLEIVHTAIPAKLSNLNGNINLPDEYFPALVDFIDHKCFVKDSEIPLALQRSDSSLNAFAMKLGLPVKTVRAAMPQQPQGAQQ